MNDNNSKTIAIILTTFGVLFMLAMAFQILPWNIAIFAGVACFILAGMVRRMAARRQ